MLVFTSSRIDAGVVDDDTWLLSKPYSRQELGKTVRSVLDARRAGR